MKKHKLVIITILALFVGLGINYATQSRANTMKRQIVNVDKDKKTKKKKEKDTNEKQTLSHEDSLRMEDEQLNASELLEKGLKYSKRTDSIEVNRNKAREYYQKAADKAAKGSKVSNEALAQLGLCYKNGLGVKQDLNKAASYFKHSAYSSNASAVGCLNWAIFCEEGLGSVTKNREEAKEFYIKAAQMGSSEAMYNLGYMYADNRVQQDAFCWFYVAAKLGYLYAITALGNCYYNGEGVEKNYVKAKECFEEASKKNDPWATYNLAIIYETGNGLRTPDLSKAIILYTQALAQDQGKGQGVKEKAEDGIKRVTKALAE